MLRLKLENSRKGFIKSVHENNGKCTNSHSPRYHQFDHNHEYCNFRFCFSAIYCIDCFADLKNVCAVCSNSIELDGSDASEER